MGYDAVLLEEHTTADSNAQGGVGMIVRNWNQGWSIDKTRFHGPNVISCKFVVRKRTPLIGTQPPPPSTMEDQPDRAEVLTHFWDQNTKVLGGIKSYIQYQIPRSQQVAKLLVYFWLVYFWHHLNRARSYDTGNVVSDLGQNIVGRNVVRRWHGGDKGWEEVYKAFPPAGWDLTPNRDTRR